MPNETPDEDNAPPEGKFLELLRTDPKAAFAEVLANPPAPRFVDLREIPIPQWPAHEYFQVIIPDAIWERIKDRELTPDEANALEVEMEAFYGVSEPFWLQYEGAGTSHTFEFRKEV